MGRKSELEERFLAVWRSFGMDEPERQYVFCDRNWTFDFAWPDFRTAVEIEGFGHHAMKRFRSDMEKYNRAAVEGWRVLRFNERNLITNSKGELGTTPLAHERRVEMVNLILDAMGFTETNRERSNA